MAWVSWNSLYLKWLDALADRDPDSFFNSSVENSREMRTTYTVLGNVEKFTEWLKSKSDEEAQGLTGGEMFSCIGGA